MNQESQTGKDNQVDAEIPSGALVEVKEGLASARDLRNALLQVLHLMVEDQEKRQLILMLVEPRFSVALIEKEVNGLKLGLRKELADRLYLSIEKDGKVTGLSTGSTSAPIAEADLNFLRGMGGESRADSGISLPRPDLQSEVFRVLLHGWLLGQGPFTSVELEQRWVGCSYRTVVAAVKELGSLIERTTDRRIYLKRFPEAAWATFTVGTSKSRNSMYFVDRSGQPRSAESLLKRLRRENLAGTVGVGGVFGAKHYYPALDIVSSPRLDLSIHAPKGTADLSFVERLDPGLKPSDDPQEPARLAIHFIRRKDALFDTDKDGNIFVNPIECLADLSDARLGEQAEDFGDYLKSWGEENSGTQ